MRRAKVLLFAACCVALAAGPAGRPSPDELVRQGNAAFAAGDLPAADRLYADAEGHTADPGLVAFNRAVAAANVSAWRDAEAGFRRALDDADAPPERRARALYNRGVCLLRAGDRAADFAAAAGCFAECLTTAAGGAELTADARHNLEVAKVRWAQARAGEKEPPKADTQDPPTSPDPKRDRPPPRSNGTDPGGAEPGTAPKQKPESIKGKAPSGAKAVETTQKAAGAGSLPVIRGDDDPSPLSADDARAALRAAVERSNRGRTANARLGAPERPHVRDW